MCETAYGLTGIALLLLALIFANAVGCIAAAIILWKGQLK